MRTVFVVITFIFALGAALAGCGSSTGNNTPPPTPALNPTSLQWTNVTLQGVVDPTSPCDSLWKFSVNADGSYTVGPCHGGRGGPATGHLSAADFNTLNTDAQNVAISNLSSGVGCQPPLLFKSGFVDLSLQNSNVVRVAQADSRAQTMCYRGGTANGSQLTTEMLQLTEKYYPVD